MSGKPSLDLVLGVKQGVWRVHDPDREASDEAYQRQRMSVLSRDGYTCQGCGFSVRGDRRAPSFSSKASGYLEVHHLDDDHSNNAKSNLVTVCPFCHQVFHCGNAGHRGVGQIVFLPWITQSELNLVVNLAAVCEHRGAYHADSGRDLLRLLSDNGRLAIQKRFGESSTDASVFGNALMQFARQNPEEYENRKRMLKGIRLLPKVNMFEEAIGFWAEKGWLLERDWPRVFERYQREMKRIKAKKQNTKAGA